MYNKNNCNFRRLSAGIEPINTIYKNSGINKSCFINIFAFRNAAPACRREQYSGNKVYLCMKSHYCYANLFLSAGQRLHTKCQQVYLSG